MELFCCDCEQESTPLYQCMSCKIYLCKECLDLVSSNIKCIDCREQEFIQSELALDDELWNLASY